MLVGDTAGAKATLEKYFTTQYMWQIDASGDQVPCFRAWVFQES